MMSDELFLINCYFNPAGFESLYRNFLRSTEALLLQGVPLISVEAAFDDEPFRLTEQPGQMLIQVRAPSRMWQKERLINIALSHLPPTCTKVAWIDGDLLFANPHWVRETNELLDHHEVVQLFDTILYLPQGATQFEGITVQEARSLFWLALEHGTEALNRMRNGHESYAVPGGAFAARREVLQFGLYDRFILGGGDCIFSYGVLGALDKVRMPTQAVARDVRVWELNFSGVRETFSYGCVPGSVYHLWHGERVHRSYSGRIDILNRYEYDPVEDVGVDSAGALEWRSAKPELHELVSQYFRGRLEDGTGTSTQVTPSTPDSSRTIISHLYRRLSDEGFRVIELTRQLQKLESELNTARRNTKDTIEWAKDLKQGNAWLQGQVALWQAHAQHPVPPSSTPTLALIAPDPSVSQSILAALKPLNLLTLELISSEHSSTNPLRFRLLNSSEGLFGAELVVLVFHYLGTTRSQLTRCSEELAAIGLPLIWSNTPSLLDWYCGLSGTKAAESRVDPAQFLGAVEEQRSRQQYLHGILGTSRAAVVDVVGESVTEEGRSALMTLLNMSVELVRPEPTNGHTILNLSEIIEYLDRTGAKWLAQELQQSASQSATQRLSA